MLRLYFGGQSLWYKVSAQLEAKTKAEKLEAERAKFMARKERQFEVDLQYKQEYYNRVKTDWWEKFAEKQRKLNHPLR